MELCKCGNTNVIEECLGVLGNIAISNKEYIELMANVNIMDCLSNLYDSINGILLAPYISWTISCIIPQNPKLFTNLQKIIMITQKYLFSDNEEVASNALKTISSLSYSYPRNAWENFIKPTPLNRIISNINHPAKSIARDSIRFIGYVCANDSSIDVGTIVHAGALYSFKELLCLCDDESTLSLAFWAISNIIVSGVDYISMFLSLGCYSLLIKCLKKVYNNKRAKSEAIILLCNMCVSANINQICSLVEMGLIAILSEELSICTEEKEILQILDSLKSVFYASAKGSNNENKYFQKFILHHGIYILNNLISHKTLDISRVSLYILSLYYKRDLDGL